MGRNRKGAYIRVHQKSRKKAKDKLRRLTSRSQGRNYDNKIKAQVTQEICVEKKSTSAVAQRYGIPLKTVENWVTKYNKNQQAYDTTIMSEKEQIKALQREVKELRKANELLKKTLLLLARKE